MISPSGCWNESTTSPKNQRFIFGTRLADHVLDAMELLVEASYSRQKTELLAKVNRKIEMVRWLIRLVKSRKLLTGKQYQFCLSARFALSSGPLRCGGESARGKKWKLAKTLNFPNTGDIAAY
jgi:hypothetical protein